MASNPPAQCCTIGVKHEGSPSGELRMLGDNTTEAYFAYPKDKSTENAILLLTDVLGHKFPNAQLLADQFAANGYFVLVPDLFHRDPLPINRPPGFDVMAWLKAGHTTDKVDPVVDMCIKEMKEKMGVKQLGAVGYCFGAKYVVRFLKDSMIEAGFVAHPSFVDEEEIKAITAPLSIAAAETDQVFPTEKRRKTEDILFSMDVPWQINLYSDTTHGFAVRADIKDARAKFAMEQAFFQAVQWFDEHIKKA